jgi:hypothetical protein
VSEPESVRILEAAMAGRTLSQELIDAGEMLLATTDSLAMQAQAAMWIYDHVLAEWRYYLVTSLVDTLGRRKTYKLLLDAFEKVRPPENMTVEDVHLGSPRDPFFQTISSVLNFPNGRATFADCVLNGMSFDGVVYRSVKTPPSVGEAERIEKRFSKRVRDLVATAG